MGSDVLSISIYAKENIPVKAYYFGITWRGFSRERHRAFMPARYTSFMDPCAARPRPTRDGREERPMPTPAEKRTELWEKIRDVKIAMLTTVGPDGKLYSRPMFTQREDREDGLWFFTERSSAKAQQVQGHADVNLSYADPGKNVYVSVAGTARIVDDPELERELWNAMNGAFFDGPDDPDLVLLQVEPQRAEYWDGSSGKVRQLFDMVKAAVTGRHDHMGENEKVDLA
jgi:general stress protein 26